jgi:hypothetical protein
VQPAQEGQAHHFTAIAADLVVEVSFFDAEALESGIEARPCLLTARKYTHALHGNLKRRCIRIGGALVNAPLAVHSPRPNRVEVRALQALVVRNQWALE